MFLRWDTGLKWDKTNLIALVFLSFSHLFLSFFMTHTARGTWTYRPASGPVFRKAKFKCYKRLKFSGSPCLNRARLLLSFYLNFRVYCYLLYSSFCCCSSCSLCRGSSSYHCALLALLGAKSERSFAVFYTGVAKFSYFASSKDRVRLIKENV